MSLIRFGQTLLVATLLTIFGSAAPAFCQKKDPCGGYGTVQGGNPYFLQVCEWDPYFTRGAAPTSFDNPDGTRTYVCGGGTIYCLIRVPVSDPTTFTVSWAYAGEDRLLGDFRSPNLNTPDGMYVTGAKRGEDNQSVIVTFAKIDTLPEPKPAQTSSKRRRNR